MSATMRVWPFLIAASRHIDYCFVLCPDFLVASKRLEIFRKREFRVNSVDPPGSDFRRITWEDPELGPLTFVFTVRRILVDGQSLNDGQRDVFETRGFVIRSSGAQARGFDITDRLSGQSPAFDKVRDRFLAVKDRKVWLAEPSATMLVPWEDEKMRWQDYIALAASVISLLIALNALHETQVIKNETQVIKTSLNEISERLKKLETPPPTQAPLQAPVPEQPR